MQSNYFNDLSVGFLNVCWLYFPPPALWQASEKRNIDIYFWDLKLNTSYNETSGISCQTVNIKDWENIIPSHQKGWTRSSNTFKREKERLGVIGSYANRNICNQNHKLNFVAPFQSLSSGIRFSLCPFTI